MRFFRAGTLAGAAAALALLISSGIVPAAQAAMITGGGFDQALGCSTAACGSSQTLTIGTTMAPVSGTIDLDTTTLTLSIQMSVTGLPMVPMGADDNGITEIQFVNTVYNAVALTLIDAGGTYLIGPGQTAMVAGIQNQIGTGAPAPGGFAALAARVNGQCSTIGGGMVCGIQFGQTNFSVDIGSPGATRYFQHTANIFVPEPTTLALMGLALLGAAAAGRRRV